MARRTGIAAAAVVIALGNIASRVVGQVRESVTADLFGAGVDASAYALASRVPTTLYDFMVGGLVSAALVPVFSELAEQNEQELGVVAGTIFSAATLLTLIAVAAAWLSAPAIGVLMTLTAGPSAVRETTTTLIRWMLPATVLMGASGLVTGLLQSRRQFLLPAFATAIFNVGIIAGAWLLSDKIGVRSLAAGMVLGAALQILLQLPGLRGAQLRVGLRLRHPAVRRIGRLYVPVLVGLSFGLIGTSVDAALASGVGREAPAVMRYATTLIQLALGIITTAVSLAALPTLARQGASNLDDYRRTLTLGLKVVLLLILPVTAALAALARPLIVLLFEQGEFTSANTDMTSRALLFYLPSLVAAAIDQPLIFAFYARKNTMLPNLVNGAAILTYLIIAFGTVRLLNVYGLILANGLQWGVHALLMLWFAHRRLNAIQGQGLGEAFGKGLVACAAAGALAFGVVQLLPPPAGKPEALLAIAVGGAVVTIVYGALVWMLRLEALDVLALGVRRRLNRA